MVVQNEHQCEEDPDGSLGDGQDAVDTGSTESPVEAVTGPVQLANEVQSDAEVSNQLCICFTPTKRRVTC